MARSGGITYAGPLIGSELMKFLDGFKTILGLVGMAVSVIVPKVTPDVITAIGDHTVAVAQGVFGLLTVLGIIHKREKAKAANP